MEALKLDLRAPVPTPRADELADVANHLRTLATTLADSQAREHSLTARIEDEKRLAALGRVVAGVAHEVRNPLAGMKLRLDSMALRPLDERSRADVEKCIREIGRLDRLVRALLLASRKHAVERVTFDATALVLERVALAEPLATSRNVEIEVSGEATIFGERESLAGVVDNLLRNAIEASPPGRTVTVRVGLENGGHRDRGYGRGGRCDHRPGARALRAIFHDEDRGNGARPRHRARIRGGAWWYDRIRAAGHPDDLCGSHSQHLGRRRRWMNQSEPAPLIVDDDESVRDALASALDEAGYEARVAAGIAAARAAIAREKPDVVLLDVRLKDGDGLAFLGELRADIPDLPVIMATAYGDGDRTIAAMKAGAFDYVTKPFDLPALLAAVARAARSRAPLARSESAVAPSSTFIGSSAAMLPVWKSIGRAAMSDVPVLITGESGVGKELTARAIHEHGERRREPFVAVNVAALPPTLVESELFGHERGAFTGANTRRVGRFELARRGTIFLDEIGDLEPALQTKLLRVLEDGSFERVGGETPISSSARVIAATSRVVKPGAGGVLREDLYYRLSVINIRVPPLRERRGDIPLLIDGFLRRRGGGEARPE